MEEAATPLPSEETTPPVTNIYFCAIHVGRTGIQPMCRTIFDLRRIDVHTIMGFGSGSVNSNSLQASIEKTSDSAVKRNIFRSSGLNWLVGTRSFPVDGQLYFS